MGKKAMCLLHIHTAALQRKTRSCRRRAKAKQAMADRIGSAPPRELVGCNALCDEGIPLTVVHRNPDQTLARWRAPTCLEFLFAELLSLNT